MGGPMPRLDPPPVPTIPTIGDAPPRIPELQVPVELKSPTLVNTRAVALDFEVTRTGSSKVTAVELWTTRDGGTTWARTDRIAGGRPPFRTRLGSEGEYGFRLVFESESGMRTPEPRAGDKPDLRVELDTTPPDVRLSPPTAVPVEPGKVRFHWTTADAHLDRGFVRLEYSADGKVWLPVNVGDAPRLHGYPFFDWVPPPGVPPRVMIRVTVRDTAGNSATASTADKVVIDLVAPAGKVTGVRPIELEVGPAPREVEAAAEPARSIPDALRSLLPALLASPSLYPPLAARTDGGPIPWDVAGNDDRPRVELGVPDGSGYFESAHVDTPRPIRTAREWVERVTDTTVVAEPALPPYRRPDPFAAPAVKVDSMPAVVVDPEELNSDHVYIGSRLPETPEERAQRLDAEQRRAANDRPLIPTLGRRAGEQLRPYRETAGYSGGRSLIHHLADADWKPTTATPASCRWEYDPAPADFWGTPPLGLRFRF
jgi:hypothetical protein